MRRRQVVGADFMGFHIFIFPFSNCLLQPRIQAASDYSGSCKRGLFIVALRLVSLSPPQMPHQTLCISPNRMISSPSPSPLFVPQIPPGINLAPHSQEGIRHCQFSFPLSWISSPYVFGFESLTCSLIVAFVRYCRYQQWKGNPLPKFCQRFLDFI